MTENVTYTWSGPPGITWIRRPPAWLIIPFLLIPALFGCLITLVILEPSKSTRIVASFTEEEKQQPILIQETWPLEMKIRIISREQFAREEPDYNTLAFAIPAYNPCEITIPAGWQIIAFPLSKKASFANTANANTIAHEILHCLRGAWHK